MEFLVCIQIPGKVSVNQEYKLGIFLHDMESLVKSFKKRFEIEVYPDPCYVLKPYTRCT